MLILLSMGYGPLKASEVVITIRFITNEVPQYCDEQINIIISCPHFGVYFTFEYGILKLLIRFCIFLFTDFEDFILVQHTYFRCLFFL